MSGVARKSLSQLYRQGWAEIPEIMGTSFLALIGLGFGATTIALYDAIDGDNKKYKIEYTVYRPDDPRAQKIRD